MGISTDYPLRVGDEVAVNFGTPHEWTGLVTFVPSHKKSKIHHVKPHKRHVSGLMVNRDAMKRLRSVVEHPWLKDAIGDASLLQKKGPRDHRFQIGDEVLVSNQGYTALIVGYNVMHPEPDVYTVQSHDRRCGRSVVREAYITLLRSVTDYPWLLKAIEDPTYLSVLEDLYEPKMEGKVPSTLKNMQFNRNKLLERLNERLTDCIRNRDRAIDEWQAIILEAPSPKPGKLKGKPFQLPIFTDLAGELRAALDRLELCADESVTLTDPEFNRLIELPFIRHEWYQLQLGKTSAPMEVEAQEESDNDDD